MTMKKAAIELNKTLLEILSSDSLTTFTVLDVQKAYIDLVPNDGSMEGIKKMIYRQIYRLAKFGVLKRDSKQGRVVYFSKTELFNKTKFIPKFIGSQTVIKPVCKSDQDFVKALNDKKAQYKVEMLTALGEAEELKALMEEFPFNQKRLAPIYISAREKSSILIGRINAIDLSLTQMADQT